MRFLKRFFKRKKNEMHKVGQQAASLAEEQGGGLSANVTGGSCYGPGLGQQVVHYESNCRPGGSCQRIPEPQGKLTKALGLLLLLQHLT